MQAGDLSMRTKESELWGLQFWRGQRQEAEVSLETDVTPSSSTAHNSDQTPSHEEREKSAKWFPISKRWRNVEDSEGRPCCGWTASWSQGNHTATMLLASGLFFREVRCVAAELDPPLQGSSGISLMKCTALVCMHVH